MDTPASLLERVCKRWDQQAWCRFVQLYSPIIFSWARRFGLQPADAADLTQDVFTTLFQTLPDKKKDFPHGLGLTILALACLTSTITHGLYDKWLTWTILIGSALFDGLLYLWVKDVLVCYRCNAHHRGVATGSAVLPFELTVHERYRQERIRREELQRGSGSDARVT